MQKRLEERKLEIVSSDKDMIELKEIIVHRVILDNNEFERKNEELELAKIARTEAEQKIKTLEEELSDYADIYKQLEEELKAQPNNYEETNE